MTKLYPCTPASAHISTHKMTKLGALQRTQLFFKHFKDCYLKDDLAISRVFKIEPQWVARWVKATGRDLGSI
jgi:hypothetical protein